MKAIIFDMDGVLFDSPSHVAAFFQTTYPTLTKDALNEMLTGNFHDEMTKFKLTNKAIDETPEEYQARSKMYSAQKSKMPLYPGMLDLLNKLHGEGRRLALNTAALERNCLPLLEYAGIKDLFDFIGTKEVSVSKVEKFRIMSEKFGVSAKDMIFMTDTLGDVREADVAGVPTIAVTWGAHDRSYFTREKHANLVAIVDSVEELEKLLMA